MGQPASKPQMPQFPAQSKPCQQVCDHYRFFKVCGADLYPASSSPPNCSVHAPITQLCDQSRIVCD
jgi:hypothetical protein